MSLKSNTHVVALMVPGMSFVDTTALPVTTAAGQCLTSRIGAPELDHAIPNTWASERFLTPPGGHIGSTTQT